MTINEMVENLKEQLNNFGAEYISQNITTADGYSFTVMLSKLDNGGNEDEAE